MLVMTSFSYEGLLLIICSRTAFILSKHWNEQKRSQRSGARIKSARLELSVRMALVTNYPLLY